MNFRKKDYVTKIKEVRASLLQKQIGTHIAVEGPLLAELSKARILD